MAIYEIKGSSYEIPDSVQGDDLTNAFQQLSEMPNQSSPSVAPSVKPTPAPRPQVGANKPDALAYLTETDRILGYPKGTSAAQIQQESSFLSDPADAGAGARGLAQVMPATLASLEKRYGRKFDLTNDKDSLFLHRALMVENNNKYGNPQDALRAYNSGWDKTKWNNPETNNYVDKILGINPAQAAPPPPSAVPMTTLDKTKAAYAEAKKASEAPPIDPEYQPWAPIRKDIPSMSLNDDEAWIRGSAQLWSMKNSTDFKGTNSELAEWGKDQMGYFTYNTLVMASRTANLVAYGTQADKEAYLYMMRTYENIDMSWEGTGRFVKAVGTDPITYATIETVGFGKWAAVIAARKGAEITILKSLGRTGIISGVAGGVQEATRSSVTQNLELAVGERKEYSYGKTAADTGIGVVAGVALGTAMDFGLMKGSVLLGEGKDWIANKFGNIFKEYGIKPKANVAPPRVEPTMTPEVLPPVPPSAQPTVTPADSAVPEPIVAPQVTPAPTPAVVSESLPKELAGAKPRWKTSTIEFESDLDKALFITSQKTKSKADAQYRTWLKTQGLDDAQIDTLGQQVRAGLKEAITEEGNVIRLGRVAPEKTAVTEAPQAPKVDEPTQVAGEQPSVASEAPTERTDPFGEPLPKDDVNLTVAEEKAAIARQQAGRLPEDNIAPVLKGEPVRIETPKMNTGLRSTTPTDFELTAGAKVIAEQFRKLIPEDLGKVMEQLRMGQGSYSLEEQRFISLGVRLYRDEQRLVLAKLEKALSLEKEPQLVTSLQKQIDEHLETFRPLYLASDAYGSYYGSALRDLRLGSSVKETVESIMAENPKLSKEEANATLVKMLDDEIKAKDAQNVIDNLTLKYDQAIVKGDFVEAGKIAAEKFTHTQILAGEVVADGAGFWRKLNEWAISMVFSTTTVIINIIPSLAKTLVLPFTRGINADPLQRATRVEIMATYSAMLSTVNGTGRSAWAAASAAYRYEQSILTRDGMRLLESEMAIKGKKGGWIRFFPRVLNMTDEFLTQVNYTGYVAGRAGARAALDGTDRGLKGKALDKFIKEEVANAVDNAFLPESSEALIQPIINKGKNLGLKGEELTTYVNKEVTRGTDALRHGTDKEAIGIAQDTLYKRRFSGEGTTSFMAKKYEEFTNGIPAWRFLCGQLFFRTPIRVFEEGIRLTPALNLLAPNFVADLSGKNGTARMLRAKSEATISMMVFGQLANLMSQGRVTGDGAYDNYKQGNAGDDTNKAPKYSIKNEDGSYWSYRYMEPISTPFKITLNAMERLDTLYIRQAQGEDIPESAFEEIGQFMSIGLVSIAMALKSANLVAGVSGAFDIAGAAIDPDGSASTSLRMLGDKLSLLVPRQAVKVAKTMNPEMIDPVTFKQVVSAKLDPFSLVEARLDATGHHMKGLKSTKAYDVLGNARTMTDIGVMWNVFSTTSQEELDKGRTPTELYVVAELDRLSKETGASFIPPIKHPKLGSLDLRTIETQDGKMTLYDKWQELYKATNPAVKLEPILRADIPDGTNLYKGVRVTEVQKMLHTLQEAAFSELLAQEAVLVKAYQDHIINKTQGEFGLRDNPRPNHN